MGMDGSQQSIASSPLLQTKLYIPRWRAGLVARPRLLERLDRAAQSKLTLVSAPAGFGKTTLLAEWLAAAPADERPVAWLSLDESDNRPPTFWTYLITALQTVQPEIGDEETAAVTTRAIVNVVSAVRSWGPLAK